MFADGARPQRWSRSSGHLAVESNDRDLNGSDTGDSARRFCAGAVLAVRGGAEPGVSGDNALQIGVGGLGESWGRAPSSVGMQRAQLAAVGMGDLGLSGCRCQTQNGVGIVGFMHLFHLPSSLAQRLCNMGPTSGWPVVGPKGSSVSCFRGRRKDEQAGAACEVGIRHKPPRPATTRPCPEGVPLSVALRAQISTTNTASGADTQFLNFGAVRSRCLLVVSGQGITSTVAQRFSTRRVEAHVSAGVNAG